jgi:hypothetical protein
MMIGRVLCYIPSKLSYFDFGLKVSFEARIQNFSLPRLESIDQGGD